MAPRRAPRARPNQGRGGKFCWGRSPNCLIALRARRANSRPWCRCPLPFCPAHPPRPRLPARVWCGARPLPGPGPAPSRGLWVGGWVEGRGGLPRYRASSFIMHTDGSTRCRPQKTEDVVYIKPLTLMCVSLAYPAPLAWRQGRRVGRGEEERRKAAPPFGLQQEMSRSFHHPAPPLPSPPSHHVHARTHITHMHTQPSIKPRSSHGHATASSPRPSVHPAPSPVPPILRLRTHLNPPPPPPQRTGPHPLSQPFPPPSPPTNIK